MAAKRTSFLDMNGFKDKRTTINFDEACADDEVDGSDNVVDLGDDVEYSADDSEDADDFEEYSQKKNKWGKKITKPFRKLLGSSPDSSKQHNSGNLKVLLTDNKWSTSSRTNSKKYDDSLTQTMLDIYREIMDSVGAIMYSGHLVGTGFRIGTEYIATAWHVISDIIDPRRRRERMIQNLSNAYIIFSNSPFDPSATKYFLTPKIHYQNDKFDVAIVELSNIHGSLPNKLILRKETLVPADADTVSVIGYGHPRKSDKSLEYRCPVVYSDSHQIKDLKKLVEKNKAILKLGLLPGVSFSVVDDGYKDFDAPHKLLLHNFMEHGASGSPILACVNPSAGIVEVVGVFTHALPEFFFNLKEEFKYLIPPECRFEAGSRIEHIYKDMRKQQTQILGDLFQ